ncbi:ABC-F family ATP-binding cassette domain-containing protein [Candidatus Saccharibacteria bacterium]|nr:ABC-F family ATP-binding cassette domain-containing protein [Candidatus Saccharibacteria bacterium]
MLLSIDIEKKTIGNKELFAGLGFTVEANEKTAIIGRNGVGKTTLFRLLTGEDGDFEGDISFKRGIRIAITKQEHHDVGEQSAVEYILQNLPDYSRLKHIIDTYPEHMGEDMRKIEAYTNALEHFSSLGYYTIETDVLLSLDAYQIDEAKARMPMRLLSGGQKRFVELVRIEHADADIALIDEPTNHMDYIAKEAFIEWLKAVRHAVVVISHDRDVLRHVDKIIEMKDGGALSFRGNYDAYLKQNAVSTTTKMHDYEVTSRQITNTKAKIIQFRRLKERARDPDTIKQFKRREQQAMAELEELEKIEKPSFWIDRESAAGLKKGASENYEKYKAKNIRITKPEAGEDARELLKVEDLTLSYGDAPLFMPLSFRLGHGDRLQLVGRNGAGKSTLVRAIVAAAGGRRADTWRGGSIFNDSKLRLSVYDQEINPALLDMRLHDAIEHIHTELGIAITDEKIKALLSNYLFNPHSDGELPVNQLSGGQKARLQLMRMLANDPNLLILDEPTNHLDLPSIEELENALGDYHGALLYVSHDSYFAGRIGGESVTLQSH